MSNLFFPKKKAAKKPAPTYTLTLERALTQTFCNALQSEMGTALTVTAAENFDDIALPACFVRATRQQESIVNSAIYQFSVDVSLAVQADDSDAQAMENLWSEVLCITHRNDIVALLNSMNPQVSYIYGILRNSPVAYSTTDRHFLRTSTLLVHAALIG